MWRNRGKVIPILVAGMLTFSLAACGSSGQAADPSGGGQAPEAAAASETGAPEAEAAAEEEAAPAEEADTAEAARADTGDAAAAEEADTAAEKNGEIYILFTSDVHCGVDQGFGYAGLEQVRDTLEEKGYETILVDDGDAIQGEPMGTFTNGEAIIELMNAAGYDVAIPGNHEFDYGTDRFLELAGKAEFTYISCNFTYKDEPVFAPYVIKEAAGRKIGFVGVTTPTTIRSSTPAYFQDENGEYVYSFKQDDTGEELYQAVQEAADAARADGAEYVYLVAHLGNEEACRPWNYVDVVSHTSGIDVVLDGHSHDTDQVVLKNKNGEDVTRSAVGTKMSCIGYSHISAEGEIVETDIWSWPNSDPAPELLGIHNKMGDLVEEAQVQLGKKLDEVVASTEVALQNLFEKELPLVREINPHIISGLPSLINSAVNMEGGAGQYRENDTDSKGVCRVQAFRNGPCLCI